MEDYTLYHLESQIRTVRDSPHMQVNVETVGVWLCGENWELAKKPFSKQFLMNVAFNGPDSLCGILWLQLNSLK